MYKCEGKNKKKKDKKKIKCNYIACNDKRFGFKLLKIMKNCRVSRVEATIYNVESKSAIQ